MYDRKWKTLSKRLHIHEQNRYSLDFLTKSYIMKKAYSSFIEWNFCAFTGTVRRIKFHEVPRSSNNDFYPFINNYTNSKENSV